MNSLRRLDKQTQKLFNLAKYHFNYRNQVLEQNLLAFELSMKNLSLSSNVLCNSGYLSQSPAFKISFISISDIYLCFPISGESKYCFNSLIVVYFTLKYSTRYLSSADANLWFSSPALSFLVNRNLPRS